LLEKIYFDLINFLFLSKEFEKDQIQKLECSNAGKEDNCSDFAKTYDLILFQSYSLNEKLNYLI
jgi:hypothetical protein